MNGDWRVNFVIAGAQKCGTTTLDAMLRAHPDIVMCKRKEAHFFDRPAPGDYADYHALFPSRPDGAIAGEATPSYLYINGAMARLAAYNPELKLIVVLRDPAMRAYSHWNMLRARGETDLSFADAVDSEAEIVQEPGAFATKKFALLARGRYVSQLKTMFSYFPRKQCLVLKYEALFSNIDQSMESIYDFLDVEKRSIPARRERKGVYQSCLPQTDLSHISAQFAEELDELAQMVDFDISDWPSAKQ